ncbi:DNA-processing protein DprA [Oricola sp.]|uniref:DNA-processing protein DprA n=1 Tax=Oricola sp. TaxID=1979950 RepID=UPI003BAC7D21
MADGRQENDAPARFVLSDRQRLAWLRLYRSDNVGPATFRDLITHCGSAELALEMLPELAARGGRLKSIRVLPQEDAEAELDAATRHGARIVGFGEPDYPEMLRLADPAPPLVTVMGGAAVFSKPCVAVVGARNASMAGRKMARMLAGDLGTAGYAIASGLARGIDAEAHKAALATGTIAVLAGGIDKPYPPENEELLERIANSDISAVITEMPFGWEPRARDFPRRNRVIAALSLGLVVAEAAMRSGSLISARYAGEMGRLVFAVPGSPLDPRAQGANALIRDGAILTASAADILEALAPMRPPESPSPKQAREPEHTLSIPPGDNDRARVVELLGPTPTDIDDIIDQTGLTPAQVFLTILELDLAQRIERHSGNRVSLLAPD